jgi:hypothetical protein
VPGQLPGEGAVPRLPGAGRRRRRTRRRRARDPRAHHARPFLQVLLISTSFIHTSNEHQAISHAGVDSLYFTLRSNKYGSVLTRNKFLMKSVATLKLHDVYSKLTFADWFKFILREELTQEIDV